MKRTVIILQLLTVLGIAISSQGQTASVVVKTSMINSDRLEISCQKTTHLIFPSAIKSVDRGSEDILVQKTGGTENVLKVKAAKVSFEETNLTVITSDGQLYSFIVNYHPRPANLNIQLKLGLKVEAPASLPAIVPDKPTALFAEASSNEAVVKKYAAKASITKRNINTVFTTVGHVNGQVCGIYTAQDILYYKIVLKNSSAIGYEIDAIRFFIREKKQVKRTSTQELSLEPIYMVGNANPVADREERMIIIALPKHTVGKSQELVAEIIEKDGSRHLVMIVKGKHILKVKKIDS